MVTRPKTQEVGGVVDDFQLKDLSGNDRRLSAALQGKRGAVVVFWSGICAHCVRYDEYLNGLERRHPDLALLALASRSGETPDQLRKTRLDRALGFPILHDSGSKVAREWFTEQTPRAFLVDSSHTLLYRGAIDNFKYPTDPEYVPYLESAISEFLRGQPVVRPDTP